MSIFEIFIVYVSWGSGGKDRPVLIIDALNTVVSVFSITTQYENKSPSVRAKYFKMADWQQAGLAKQSYIDTNTVLDLSIAALSSNSPIGKLTGNDIRRLMEFLEN